MEERNYRLQAVILHNRDFKENDKLVSFFSSERGKETALAKGARKPNSSLRGIAQPFCEVEIDFAKGRGSLDIITQGQMRNAYLHLHNDLDKIAYASYIAELTDLALPEKKAAPAVFYLLLATLTMIDLSDQLFLAARFFELRLLTALGISPLLNCCSGCGHSISASSFYLSPYRGGLLCSSCSVEQPRISAGTVRLMQYLATSDLKKVLNLKINDQMGQEMEKALEVYLNYYLEKVSQAKRFINQLEKGSLNY